MPPKAKFTKEEVVVAALKIVQREGAEALTARALGEELGSSSRPVFTVFESMDEVKNSVISAAKQLYSQYVREGMKCAPAFKGVGVAYIKFAAQQPKLFQLLFMREIEGLPDMDGALGNLEDNYELILQSVSTEYGVDNATAHKIYRHLWVYSHGIAVLTATKVCRLSGEEISDMLTEVFVGLLMNLKQEG